MTIIYSNFFRIGDTTTCDQKVNVRMNKKTTGAMDVWTETVETHKATHV